MEKKRIVITGMGVVSPIGVGCGDFVNALKDGKSGASFIDTFDTTDFNVKFAGLVKNFKAEDYMDKKNARRSARFIQLGIAAAKMAVQDSGLNFEKEDKSRIGCITGTGMGGMDILEREHTTLISKGPHRVSPFLIPMLIANMLPGEIAIEYGITGTNYTVTSACASSNHAMGDSLRLLRCGDADVIITGGTESAVTPIGVAGFCSLKALSIRNDDIKTASRPFDKNRDGFMIGEGAGILVFETLEHALKRGAKIYAEVLGYGASDDAYLMTAPDPEAKGAISAIEKAILDAGISKDDIDYINAHGTSTHLNDLGETIAIKKVFGNKAYKIPINSTKSMTGHLLGAAGAVEAIATVLCMKEGFIHPTINYETPDSECDLDYVPNKARQQQINCGLSNSLGFGGHNAAIVFKNYVG